MADNVVVNAATVAGSTLAADDIGGVLYPRSKIVIGADSVNDGDVSATNPLPALLRSEQVDDAGFMPATSRIAMIGFEFDDTLPDSVDEGDGGAARMSANRCQYIMIRDGAGNERGLNVDANGRISVTLGTSTNEVTCNAGTNLNTSLLALEAGNLATIAAGVTPSAASLDVIDDWDETDRCKVNLIAAQSGVTGGAGAVAANTQRVTLASDDPAVVALQIMDDWDETDRAKVNIIAGQVAITAGAGAVAANTPRMTLASDDPLVASSTTMVASLAAILAGTTTLVASSTTLVASSTTMVASLASLVTLQTGVAHDAIDSGNPFKIGAKAQASISALTVVATSDRSDLFSDLDGVLPVRLGSVHGDFVNGNASSTDGSSVQVIAASTVTGTKIYLTDVTLTNNTTVNTYVELKTGATVKWTFPFPANGGATHRFATPLAGDSTTAWNFDPGTTIVDARCSMSGYKSKA